MQGGRGRGNEGMPNLFRGHDHFGNPFFRRLFSTLWTAEVFNEELMKYQHVEEQMVQMLQIGVAYVARVPDMRPSMDDVIKMIVDLRSEDLSEHQASSEDNKSKISNVYTL
ncbi:hypothetical protein Tco_0080507 [Tanacetum coccineum]